MPVTLHALTGCSALPAAGAQQRVRRAAVQRSSIIPAAAASSNSSTPSTSSTTTITTSSTTANASRPSLAAAAAAIITAAALAAAPAARADFSDDAVRAAYEDDMARLAREVDPEVVMPPELRDFLALFESGAAPKDLKRLDAARERAGFRRGADGRVSLIASGGEALEVKADAQAPGYLLLRDARGYVYYLPPDPSGRLAQVDLSDDVLVAQLFASGAWEELVEPVEAAAAPGGDTNASGADVVHLRLRDEEWRFVSSLLDGAQELPEEPLEDLEGS